MGNLENRSGHPTELKIYEGVGMKILLKRDWFHGMDE